ncbi:hypothetical protein INT44_003170 [Umbelopsis vinacea]|uniref:BTB domain-containing protein n=1 Tax=Umbelopsis vinacea TaxID=44442 RepID=A0A8H7Q6H6_9FUNG|nr:hypothetical protein INT44_003170 [Umbelopsis vinacea]
MSSIFKAVYENNVESIKQFIRDADRTAPSLSRDSQNGAQGSRRKQVGSMTNINKRSMLGRTALHLAAHWNRVEIVQLLVDCVHVNVNLRDRESGWTALHRALYAGHIESALVILAREDTDLSVKDFEGNTALDLYNSTIDDTNPSARTILPDLTDKSDGDLYSFSKSGILDSDESNGVAGGTEVFTWGYNTNYVLGQRDSENRSRPDRVHLNLVSQQLPQVLKRPEYVITSVTMSKFHSAITTSEPEQNLLICGFGGARLGLGNEDTQFLFKPVSSIHGHVAIAALGRDHTIVVTSTGETYSFGNNLNGQLGYETEKHQDQRIPQFTPRKIVAPSIKKERIIGAAASSVHSAVYTETDLYTFGLNQGQLGYYATSGECDQVLPRKVSFLPPGARIIQAACIDTATMVLTASHDVFILFGNGHQKVIFPMQRFPPDFISYTAAPNYITRIVAGGDDFMGAMSNMGDLFIWSLPSKKGSTGGKKPRTSSLTPTAEPQRSRSPILPRRIWALRKSHLTLSDASIGQDGSVIVCTTSGHVFVGTPRKIPKKNKNLVEKKLYKFIKIPYMQRCIMVTASPSGAYAALRAERLLKKIPVPESTLANDLVMSLPHVKNAYHLQQSRDAEALAKKVLQEERSKVPFLTETEHIDQDEEVCNALISPSFEWNKYSEMTETDYTIDAVMRVGDVCYYCHQIVLASRSTVLREILSSKKPSTKEKIELRHKSGRIVQLSKVINEFNEHELLEITVSDIHMETIWFFLDFIYSDRYDHPMNAFYGKAQHYTGRLKVITELQTHIKPETLQRELLVLSEVFQLSTLKDSIASSFNSQPRQSLASQIGDVHSDEKLFSFLSNVKLQLEDGELLCHELVLRQRSPFFAALFDPASIWTYSRRQESRTVIPVDMKYISEKTMNVVLSYIYCDNRTTLFHYMNESPEVIFDLISKVLEAADELMLDDLKVVCESALLQLVTPRNILKALDISDDYRAENVKQACIDFLVHNMDFYLETGSLIDLKASLISDIQRNVHKLQSNKAFLSREVFDINWNEDGHAEDPELSAKVQMDYSEESIWPACEESYCTIYPVKSTSSGTINHDSGGDDDLMFQQDEDIMKLPESNVPSTFGRSTKLTDVLYDTPDNEHDNSHFPALGNSFEGRSMTKAASIPVPKRGWSIQMQDSSPKKNIREMLERQEYSPSSANKLSPTRPFILPKKLSQKERRKLQQQEAAISAETTSAPKSVWGKPIQPGQPVAMTPSPPVGIPLSTPPTPKSRKVSIADIMDEEKAQKNKGKHVAKGLFEDSKKIFDSREAAEQSVKAIESIDPRESISSTLSNPTIRIASNTYKPTLISKRKSAKDLDHGQGSSGATHESVNSFADIQSQQLKEKLIRGQKFKKSLLRIQQEEQAIAALMEFYTQTVDIGTGEWFRITRTES